MTLLVLVTVGLVALMTLLLVVPYGERRVVLRSGTVRRVAGAGVTWRLPLVEQSVRMVSEPHWREVRVRATTVDEVPVLVLAEVEVRFLPPEVGRPWADPWPEAERQAEQTLTDVIGTLPVAQLRYALRAAEAEIRQRLGTAVGRLGVEVRAVEVLEVDLPLANDHVSE